MSISTNYKLIRRFRGKSPSEIAAGTGISKQNLSLWENDKSNPGPEFIDLLSKFLDVPKEWFYKDDLTIPFLESQLSKENHTQVQDRSDNKGKSLDDIMSDAFKKMTSDTGDYYMVPKAVFEGNYRFVPVEEFEMREKELEMRERELARKHDDLVRKDTQIQGLYDLFRLALAGRNVQVPEIPKSEEGQKNTAV